MHIDISFHHDVAMSADEDEMLDIVASHENEPAVRVDGCRIHDRQTRLAIAPARHIGTGAGPLQQQVEQAKKDEGGAANNRPQRH